jgi:sulfoxide reductase heme-binding subunit YedZ
MRLFKPAVFAACAVPLALLALQFYRFVFLGDQEALGIDPVKTIEDQTGKNTLTLLLVTLSVTPLRRLTGLNRLQSVRRMLGVWTFVYAVVHVAAYLAFDRGCVSFEACQFDVIWTDVSERRFIFAGFTAFVILFALTVTSTGGWVRRLGRNWARLHRLVYVAAIAAIVHFIWIQKSDIREPLVWGAAVAALLGVRAYFALKRRRGRPTGKTSHAVSVDSAGSDR